MRITSANLQMAATHAASQRHEISESLRAWIGSERPDFEGQSTGRPLAAPVQISDAARTAQGGKASAADKSGSDSGDSDPKLLLIKTMLEFLTGRQIRLFDASSLGAAPAVAEVPDPNRQAPPPAGYGIEYDYHETFSESEKTTFSASGTVHTSDGRQIDFQLDLVMERTFQAESQATLRLGDAARKKDPLVLNFSGTAAQLTDTRFKFDLDRDGQAEKINFAAPGSGFLVLDRNRDGKVNDGTEMFGPASGDGFAELAGLDSDHNGWIDENDAAYRDLRIWIKDTDGKDRLESLTEAEVGAIALERVNTPFDLKDETNRMQGQMRSSGVFLHESGKAGTIQQIDLTI